MAVEDEWFDEQNHVQWLGGSTTQSRHKLFFMPHTEAMDQ